MAEGVLSAQHSSGKCMGVTEESTLRFLVIICNIVCLCAFQDFVFNERDDFVAAYPQASLVPLGHDDAF